MTIRPQRCRRMCGSAACAKLTTERRFCRKAPSHSSIVVARNSFAGGPPALGTAMSRRPKRAAVSSTRLCTAASSLTSTLRTNTSTPNRADNSAATCCSGSSRRAHRASDTPSCASANATARPMP